MSGIYRSLSSDWLRSLRSTGHRSWQIRQPAAQSKLHELRQKARSACFVPVIRKTQNNRNFTLSRTHGFMHHCAQKRDSLQSADYKESFRVPSGILSLRSSDFVDDFRFAQATSSMTNPDGFIPHRIQKEEVKRLPLLGAQWDSNPRHSEPQSDALTN